MKNIVLCCSVALAESVLGYVKSFELKLVSEYGQEIPQSQTADKPMAPQGRATKQSQDTRKTN